jgi:hypothetical protein
VLIIMAQRKRLPSMPTPFLRRQWQFSLWPKTDFWRYSDYVLQTPLGQAVAKCRRSTIASIGKHGRARNAAHEQLIDFAKGDLPLGLEYYFFGNSAFLPPDGIITP